MWGCLLGRAGVLGLFWGRSEVVLQPCWSRYEVVLECSGVVLGSFGR